MSVATAGLMVGPAFAHGFISSVAGAKAECTIIGTAADDFLNGTTRDDVICIRAGNDLGNGFEGKDLLRMGGGDDEGNGDDGSDIVKGQADHDDLGGGDENDMVYGGQGADDPVAGNSGNDFIKTVDHVSGNDVADGNDSTDTCIVDAGDTVNTCE